MHLTIFRVCIPTDEDYTSDYQEIAIPLNSYKRFKAILGQVEATIIEQGRMDKDLQKARNETLFGPILTP